MTPRRRRIGLGLGILLLLLGGLILAPCSDGTCGVERERIGVFLVMFGLTLTVAMLGANAYAWWRSRTSSGRSAR